MGVATKLDRQQVDAGVETDDELAPLLDDKARDAVAERLRRLAVRSHG